MTLQVAGLSDQETRDLVAGVAEGTVSVQAMVEGLVQVNLTLRAQEQLLRRLCLAVERCAEEMESDGIRRAGERADRQAQAEAAMEGSSRTVSRLLRERQGG